VKPWEETWRAGGMAPRFVFKGDALAADYVGEMDDADRARLAACAPEMARVLHEVEWHGEDGGCPSCAAMRVQGHFDGCRLEALLRKAGVR